MAKCSIQMPEDFLNKLRVAVDREPEIAEKALVAGGEIVLDKAQSNLSRAIGSGTKYPSRATGALASSLGLSSVKVDREGNHNIKVGFEESRADGKKNAMLASVLEYGKHGQPARPFLKPAKSSSKNAAIEAMKQVFEREVGSL